MSEHRIDTNIGPVVMFGLGVQFQDCYPQLVLALGREPDFLCDNAPEKWGRQFFGRSCISPAELTGLGKNISVVITIRRYEDVYRQLQTMGIQNIFVASYDQGYDIVHAVKRLTPQPSNPEEPFESPVIGKWALVTGASRGIGRQIALAMAALGANLIIAHSRDLSHTRELIERCRALGVQAEPIAAELGNPAELEQLLERLEHYCPPIDIIFNNAGISLSCGPDIWNISPEDYLTHYTVNTIAPIRICYRLIPPMIQRGYGRVVNISSTIQKTPSGMAYACSKAALSKFVHDMAPSLEGTGVMLSLVCPGYVRSDMGGPNAPHPVESVVPGVLLGAIMDGDVNGRYFIAQDYAGLSLTDAVKRARFYYSQEG